MTSVIHKTHFSNPLRGLHGKMTFAVSAESTDRYGDIVVQAGIDYRRYLLNSVALFNHDSAQPVGTFKNLRIQNGKLHADLEFLPVGLSPRVDEIRALCEHGVIKGTSIGFFPVEQEPIITNGKRTGTRFTKSELVEISVCPIPAQSEALAVARSLKISRGTMAKVFTNGSLVSEHIAQARKAVAEEHQHSSAIARIEKRIEALWTRIGDASTEQEQQLLIKSLKTLEKSATLLTPAHLRSAEQKRALQLDALAREQARDDNRWGTKAHRAEVDRRSTEFLQQKEAEYIAEQKARGTYISSDPAPSSGNTVRWRNQTIDLTPVWRGKKIY